MLNVWETWFLYLVIYSFIGWAYESTVCSVAERKLVNRGFLNGPVCPIYGVGAVAVIALLNPLKDNILALFFSSATLTTTLEYVTSWLMETLLHARWWDYSQRRWNINGRICAVTLIPFGILGLVMIYLVKPFLFRLFAQIPQPWMDGVCAVLVAVFLTDTVIPRRFLGKFVTPLSLRAGTARKRLPTLSARSCRRVRLSGEHCAPSPMRRSITGGCSSV